MAGKGKVPVIHVVVCGLTSSSFQGLSGQGAGKSVLCNRFIRPNQDDLRLEHNSVLNLSEFGTNVINNNHFLYWGEKLAGMDDGQTVRFQIVEHTEFVDDSSLKPFPHTKPYHKRVTQHKLQCSGKTTYIEPDQLSLPEEYADAGRFPDKFTVDGFIVCVDVSTDFNDPHNPQKEFFDRLLSNVLEAKKKPIVVAMTKYDRAIEGSVSVVSDIVAKAKKPIPMIEVSALKGVNVELCFLVLAHLVDTRKPRSKMVTYSESKGLLDNRIHNNEESFQKVLNTNLTHFDMQLKDARKMLESHVEFKLLTELCGTERVNRLIRAKLRYLKQELVKRKETAYIEMLPHIFEATLPNLELSATLKSCKEALHCSTKFPKYFTDVKNWKEDTEFLKREDNDHLPFEILDEDTAEDLLQKHIDAVLKELREEAACSKIQEALFHSVGLQPGVDMEQLWSDLGVANNAMHVPSDRLIKIYHDYMGNVEQQCLTNLEELLLEHHDIFDPDISSEAEMITKVSEELKDHECYKRLDKRPGIRHSQILKHIGGLQLPERSIYGKSHLGESIRSLQAEGTINRERLKPPSHVPKLEDSQQWVLDPKDQLFNLSILARTTDNAITLRSDFMNHLSGGGTCQVDDRTYQLEMSLFVGDDIETMTNENFCPQGAVAVVNTMDCLSWLEKVLERHWIPHSNMRPPYRGMPLIILALDASAEPDIKADSPQSPLHQGAKRLANIVQCVCVMERPTPQPKRLVVTTVIHQLILSLMNGVSHIDEYLKSKLKPVNPRGLNIAVCTLRDDPYPTESLLTPWLRHQLVSGNEGDTTALFVRSAIDKQHRTCTLTFHSALNLKDILSFVRLGIILVYSTQRPASLAVIKALLAKLPSLPKLIVAMAMDGSHDNKLLEEGRSLANSSNAMFVCNNGETLPINFCSDFLYKCWFSRFTSYNAQEIKDEIRQQLHVRTRRLPDRPSFLSSEPVLLPAPPPPLPHLRHSIGAFLDKVVVDPNAMTDGPSSGTLPRPPSRSKAAKASSTDDDDGAYSNPIELMKGLKQKKQATLERQKILGKVAGTPPPPFLSPTHTLRYGSSDNLVSKTLSLEDILRNETTLEGDYASVQDAVRSPLSPNATASAVPQPRERDKSPSMSPPPIPRRADHQAISGSMNGIARDVEEIEEEEDPNAMYATVQKSVNKKKLLTDKGHGYDRLDTQDSLGYDHLLPQDDGLDSDSPIEAYAMVDKRGYGINPPIEAYVTVNERGHGGNSPIEAYATVDERGHGINPPIEAYATVDERGHGVNPPIEAYATVDERGNDNIDQMYATVDTSKTRGAKPRPKAKTPPKIPPRRDSKLTSVPPTAASGGPVERPAVPRGKSTSPKLTARTSQSPLLTQQRIGGWEGQGQNGGPLYSAVQKPTRPKHKRHASADNMLNNQVQYNRGNKVHTHSVHQQQPPPMRTANSSSDMADMYATVQKPSQKPTPREKPHPPPRRVVTPPDNGALYSVPDKKSKKPPPPIAPKPRGRQTPSPQGQAPSSSLLAKYRSESFDADQSLTRPSLLPDMEVKSNRSMSTGGRRAKNSLISPEPNDSRTSSLPKDFRGPMSNGFGAPPPPPQNGEPGLEEEVPPSLPERRYLPSEMGLEEEAPPLPPRLYSWSDVEDNDDELFQSDDDLDDTSAPVTISDHQKIYSSISRLSQRSSTMSGIQDIYNAVNKIAAVPESMPQDEIEESAYDTLENVVKSIRTDHPTASYVPLPGSGGVTTATTGRARDGMLTSPEPPPRTLASTPPGLQSSTPLTPRELKIIKQQQKLLEKLQKKAQKEADRRRQQEDKKRRRGKGKKGKKEERTRYFGSTLESVVESDGVPMFVKKCVQIIEEKGLKTEGIYRVSGKKDDVMALQEKYDEDHNLDINSLGYCEAAVSSTLKAFFKLLPDPLISDDIAAKVLVINSLDADSQRTRIHEILSTMPRPNLKTLKYLVKHLHVVHQNQDSNKMTASNLAIVFWPTLMRPPLIDLADSSKQLGWQLIMTRVIEHPDFIPEVD